MMTMIIIAKMIKLIIIPLIILKTSLVVCHSGNVRYPYKKYHGLPPNCSGQEEFNKCEDDAKNSWSLKIDDYFIRDQAFCCFVWEQLDCELKHAKQCAILLREYDKFTSELVSEEHVNFAEVLLESTTNEFARFCGPFQRASYRCYFTTKRIIFISLMCVLALILAALCFSIPGGNYALIAVVGFVGDLFVGVIGSLYNNPQEYMKPYWEPDES